MDNRKKKLKKHAEKLEKVVINDPVKKGYNEKNPGQPQGAFKPDQGKAKK